MVSQKSLREHTINAAAASLIALFSYAALAKLLDFSMFRVQMRLQPFPAVVAIFLTIALPATELFVSALLLFSRTQRYGFIISCLLLFLFTGYAGLAVVHFWNQTPCPCGGVLGSLSWPWHLAFNTFFLTITIIGTYLSSKERRPGD